MTTEKQITRIKRKFLWFPKTLSGKTKWLTTATWKEILIEDIPMIGLNESQESFRWDPINWVENLETK